MTVADVRAGAAAVVPLLVGIIPFGLVAGATPPAEGLGAAAAIGFSAIVFAGASQLAAVDVLADGGSAVVAVLAACTINLRMLLYSASLAPFLTGEPFGRRMMASYLLTDQAYAISITRWTSRVDACGGDPAGPGTEPERRLPYFFGGGLLLWAVWQLSTVVGVLVGSAVPDDLPLDFAVPLVFLVLLVPTLTTRPAVVAGAVGGAGAVLAAEVGAGPLSVIVGAVSGIIAGALVEAAGDRAPAGTP